MEIDEIGVQHFSHYRIITPFSVTRSQIDGIKATTTSTPRGQRLQEAWLDATDATASELLTSKVSDGKIAGHLHFGWEKPWKNHGKTGGVSHQDLFLFELSCIECIASLCESMHFEVSSID